MAEPYPSPEYFAALVRAVARLQTEIRYGTVQGILEVSEAVAADLERFKDRDARPSPTGG